MHSEDHSPFNERPTLVKKYKLQVHVYIYICITIYRVKCVADSKSLVQKLIGKGGFSEVWKAYDLQEFREVAVKVCELCHHGYAFI